jgi:hypothetical protein
MHLAGIEVNFFLVDGNNLNDNVLFGSSLTLVGSLKRVDTLKDLLNMLVDGCGVLGLSDDLQKIIIREEVETREITTLSLQELLQLLLDTLKLVVLIRQEFKEVLALANQSAIAVALLGNASHLLLELLINLLESG